MPRQTDLPLTPLYRLIVRAQPSGRRGFIWQINQQDSKAAVKTSTEVFRTMEEAHTRGLAALRAYSALH
jgi:hypothetical protein